MTGSHAPEGADQSWHETAHGTRLNQAQRLVIAAIGGSETLDLRHAAIAIGQFHGDELRRRRKFHHEAIASGGKLDRGIRNARARIARVQKSGLAESPLAGSAGICFSLVTLAFHQGCLLYRWCTDEVEPQDRFDYWREVRARGLFGVTAELEREQRADFFGEFSLRKIGGAGLVELRASPYRVERSRTDIANAPGDSICIYQQLGGGGWFGGMRDGNFTIADGSFATSHTDLPYHTAPLKADGFHLRILKIPASSLPAPTSLARDLSPKTFDDCTLAPLLKSCFADLVEVADDNDAAHTGLLVQALAHLALVERGVVSPGSHRARHGLRIGRLSQARRLIARQLQNPDLSPAMVAGQLGVSLRHVHMLFEMAETSFSRTVIQERLKLACRLLVEAPDRLVADIAFACGFESLATFYRVFGAAHGMAPGDFRAQRAVTR